MVDTPKTSGSIPFKAETRQILDILIHSLYTEREIFLRELISNASDALTRLEFEMLTNHEIIDPGEELGIWISCDPDTKTITIRDTGIGMNAAEMGENLGTIAHSGARAFMNAAKQTADKSEETGQTKLADIIGQFGVGFYSVFMVANEVRVNSRSFRTDDLPASWVCFGGDTYSIEPSEKTTRGTEIVIHLTDDAAEFSQEFKLREIIHKHSDFVPFPIYLGKNNDQANKRTALWRQSPRQIEKKDYIDFYKQMTLDFEDPITYSHISADAPVQIYSVLFLPAKAERGMFTVRKEDGLKLYARKILIQEYCKDLLPEYLGFVQGVVDSEDLPLNVSRENVQANTVMARLKKLITAKAIDMLKKLAADDSEAYSKFWQNYGRYIKHGISTEQGDSDALNGLLRFHTTSSLDAWSSLEEYLGRMKEDQPAIYYILGDEERSAMVSPHLDVVRQHGYEVILMSDPLVDPFMLLRLKEYQGKELQNIAQADLKLPEISLHETPTDEQNSSVPPEDWISLVDRFKQQLGEKVSDVRMTDRLSDSPARLVDPSGSPNQEMQRVYRLLKEDFETPKKVLELNPRHPIIRRLNDVASEDDRIAIAVDQLYENALLIEGLHKDPASMIGRIHKLIEKALH